jgi:CRISPR-associated protein Csd2
MSLSKKIDFAVIFKVVNANPNGDPLNGNRPRTTYEGLGEITDVCIKRKIRNRLMESGENIFVQSDDNKNDSFVNLRSRAEAILTGLKSPEQITEKACQTWFDVRAFGQLFPFKGAKKSGKKENGESVDEKGTSVGIRGPVSIQAAFSISKVEITSDQITKSTSLEGDGINRQADQMGMKHRVDRGIYTFYGSMNPQLSVRTGFNDADAAAIKGVLPRLFENDASSARPEGSMEVLKVVWWEHNCPSGQCSSAKVHRSLKVEDTDDLSNLISFEELNGPTPEIINGV